MKRLLLAFTLAVSGHILLLGVPFVSVSHPPRLTSDKSITITLSQSRKKVESTAEIPRKSDAHLPVTDYQPQNVEVRQDKHTAEKREIIKPEAVIKTDSQIVPKQLHPDRIKKKISQTVSQQQPQQKHQAVKNPVREPTDVPSSAHIFERDDSFSERSPAKNSVIEAAPLYEHNPKPLYPGLARKRRLQGTVVVKVLVSVEGLPVSCFLHKSSSHDILDQSALRAVKQWRFKPGTINGEPHQMEALIPVHFVLK